MERCGCSYARTPSCAPVKSFRKPKPPESSFPGLTLSQSCASLASGNSSGGLMSLDAIKTVAVMGAGTMGNGIAHVFARAGYQVILRDVEQRFLDRGVETISKNLDREVKKGKLTDAEKPAVLSRIHATTDI